MIDDTQAIASYERSAETIGAPRLFEDAPPPLPDTTDPLLVSCPTCGQIAGRSCRNIPGGGYVRRTKRDPHYAHEARRAYARHIAGVADMPAPTLLDEAEARCAPPWTTYELRNEEE